MGMFFETTKKEVQEYIITNLSSLLEDDDFLEDVALRYLDPYDSKIQWKEED